MKKQTLLYVLYPLLLIGLSAGMLSAQEQEDEEDSDIFELSPFQVDESADLGYYSAQTLAGGRLKSNLRDVATTVQVVTQEMLEDVGATGLDEVLVYTTNTDVLGPLSVYGALDDTAGDGTLEQSEARQNPNNANRVRGLAAATRTTNYFESFIPFDRYNSDRIDINRGANSFLFGLGSPGGIINSNLSKASFRDDTAEISFQVSTENFEDNYSNRISVNLNKVLIEGKLAIRVAALEDNREFTQRPAYRDTSRQYAALQFKPFEDHHIVFNANYEEGDIESVPVDRLSPLETLSGFLDDPFGTQWAGVGHIPNAAGRRIQDPFGNVLTSNSRGSSGYLGTDINGVQLTTGQYDNFIKRNGWASVYDGTEDANGISGRGVHTGWTNNRVRRGSAYYDPGNNFTGRSESVMTRNLRISDYDNISAYDGFANQGLHNYDVFDFRRNLLTGTIDNFRNEFDRRMFSLEAVTEDGNFGIELSYAQEDFFRDSFVAIPAPTIDIDHNYSFPIGPSETFNDGVTYPIGPVDPTQTVTEGISNPNFGRLYFYAPSSNQTINNDDRETKRLTAFAKFDFEEHFDDGILKWFGRHTLTALLDDHTLNEQRFVDKPAVFGNNADFYHSTQATIFQRLWSGFFYISDPVLQAWEDPNFGLSDFHTDGLDPRVSVKFPENVQIPLAYLWEGDPATEESRTTTLRDGRPEDGLYTPQFAPFSGVLTKTVVESYAANLQSFLFADHLVANMGWRKDELSIDRNALPPLTEADNPIRDPEVFNLDHPNTSRQKQDSSTFSYGLVLKTPQDWLPEGTSLSFHYGESENFVPNPNGFTFTGENVPNGDGTTKEMGVSIGLMDDKFVARINHYKGSLTNERYRPVTSGIQQIGNADIGRFFQGLLLDMDQYDRDRDGQFDLRLATDPNDPTQTILIDPDVDDNGFLDEIEPGGESYVEGAEYMPLADFITLFNAYDEFYNPWARETAEHMWTPGTIPGSNEDAQFSASSGLSEVLTDTVDLDAQGWELELTYNPSRNLRLSMNVTQQEAVRTNVAPRLKELIDAIVDIHNLVPDGNRLEGTQRSRNRLTRPLDAQDYGGGTIAGRVFRGNPGRNYFQQAALAGSDNPEVREWRVNAFGNYSFTEGKLKGFNVGGAYRWQDRAAIGYPVFIGEEFPVPFKDVTAPYYDDGSEFVDLWVGYRGKLTNKVNWRIQLNVRNVFADSDPLVVLRQPDGSVGRVSIPVPRVYQLSNTFSF
ncbi:MAG: TonB-dependent receptor plug domain-containing protein [Opitutae bacterium]|nr:TonB-dependent receptor plug domain-containing protein [Opitutae bacterium]